MNGENCWGQPPFIRIPPALFQSGLNAAAIAVYCALARWVTDNRGHCWRTEKNLALDTNLSETTVHEAIKSLKKANWIKVTLHRGAHSDYALMWHGSDIMSMQTTEESGTPRASLLNSATVKPAQQREKDGKWHATRATSVSPRTADLKVLSIWSKEKERAFPNPLFSIEKQSQEPKQTDTEEPGQNPEPKVKQTARQEQARAHAAADCTYGEDGQFHLGRVARAWIAYRNPEHFILDRLIDDDEQARAAEPWEPIADPLGHVLELVEAWDRLYQANKVEDTAKHKAVIEARQVARRQQWEQEHPQAIRQHGSLHDTKGSET